MSRSEDAFDFSDQMFTPVEESEPAKDNIAEPAPEPKDRLETEVRTSYLLVNVLLNLLVRKRIIHQHEVQSLLGELHKDYMEQRKGTGGNEA
jgi:hypothetical protein